MARWPSGRERRRSGRAPAIRPARPPLPASRRHTFRFVLFAVLALVAVRFPLPWMAAGLVAVVAADVEGVRVVRALGREGARPVARVWAACGIALLSVLGVGVAATLALYPATHERQECLRGANTHAASAACQAQFDQRVGRMSFRLTP